MSVITLTIIHTLSLSEIVNTTSNLSNLFCLNELAASDQPFQNRQGEMRGIRWARRRTQPHTTSTRSSRKCVRLLLFQVTELILKPFIAGYLLFTIHDLRLMGRGIL